MLRVVTTSASGACGGSPCRTRASGSASALDRQAEQLLLPLPPLRQGLGRGLGPREVEGKLLDAAATAKQLGFGQQLAAAAALAEAVQRAAADQVVDLLRLQVDAGEQVAQVQIRAAGALGRDGLGRAVPQVAHLAQPHVECCAKPGFSEKPGF